MGNPTSQAKVQVGQRFDQLVIDISERTPPILTTPCTNRGL